MRIREMKEENRQISEDLALVFEFSDKLHDNCYMYQHAARVVEDQGYVKDSLCFTGDYITADFRTSEEGEMTPAEVQAYHYLRFYERCDTTGSCDTCIIRQFCDKAEGAALMPLFSPSAYETIVEYFKGKEVIE